LEAGWDGALWESVGGAASENRDLVAGFRLSIGISNKLSHVAIVVEFWSVRSARCGYA